MTIAEKANLIKDQFFHELKELHLDSHNIKSFKDKFLGRKGTVSNLFIELKNISNKEKPEAGKILNQLRKELTYAFEKKNRRRKERK